MPGEQTIADLLINIGVKAPDAEKAEQKIKGVRQEATKTGQKGGAALKSLAKYAKVGFAAIATAAVAAAAAVVKLGKSIYSFVDETTSNLDKIAKGSQKAGMGTEEFQRLAFAAERSGSSIEALTKASQKFNQNMLDAAAGGGKMFTDALDELGLSFELLEGKTTTEQLGMLGDALLNVEDTAVRAALAAKILGMRGGPELVPLLNEGKKGIKELAGEATGIIKDETIGKATAFRDELTNMMGEVAAVKAELAVELIPVVKDFLEQFLKWVRENENFIKQDIPKIIKGISDVLLDLIPLVQDTIEGFQGFFKEIKQLDERLTEDFGPAWKAVKVAVLAALFPIKLIADAIGAVIDRIVEFVRSSETLLALARRLGIGAFEDVTTTKMRGAPRPGETPEETEARLLAESRRREREKEVDKILRQDLRETLELNKKFGNKFVAETVKRAKGRKFTQIERTALRNVGRTDTEILRYERANLRRAAKPEKAKAGAKKEEEKKEEVILAPLGLLYQQVLGPEFKAEELPSMKQVGLKKEDIKPEAIINITNHTWNIDQDISGVLDPVEAGKQAAAAIKREFDVRLSRAGQSVQVNTVR